MADPTSCQHITGARFCPYCGHDAMEGPCPLEGMDTALLDPTKAIGAVTGATCNPDDGVCEACQ